LRATLSSFGSSGVIDSLAPRLVVMRFALVFLLAAVPLAAQRPPRQPPCQAAEASQLDFWLGDWELERWTRTGPGEDEWEEGSATNLITKECDGCVVREVFRVDGKGDGESLSVWDTLAQR